MQYQRTGGSYALLLGIVIVGAWLRLRNLGADSIWLDEAVSWLQSKGTLADLIATTARDNYPPLHNLILFASMKVSGGDSEWVLRLPSALLGIANIAAIAWLGTLIGGRVAGVLAAAMLAASSMHIYYSQEARMYALLALAATLYAASAFFFVKSPTAPRAALVGVCGLALVYSHPFGTLNWIAIAIGISAHLLLTPDFPRRGRVQWLAANAAIGLGFLPWAVVLLKRAQAVAGHFWPPYPSPGYVLVQLGKLCGGALAAVAVVVGAAVAFRRDRRASWVLLVWLLGPIAVALVVSWTSTHIFVRRYLIGELPALLTLAALGMAHLASRPHWSMRAAAAVLLAIVAAGNLNSLISERKHRDDWRTVAAHLARRLQPSDCVLVYPRYEVAALRYYLRTPFCAVLPRSIAATDVQAPAGGRLFAVLVSRSIEPAQLRQVRAAASRIGREVERLRGRNITVVEYRRQP